MAGEAYNVIAAALPDASKDLKAELAPTPPVKVVVDPPMTTELCAFPPVMTTFVASSVLKPILPALPERPTDELFEAVIVVVTEFGTVMLKVSIPETFVRLSAEVVAEEEVVPTVTFNVSTPPAPAAMV